WLLPLADTRRRVERVRRALPREDFEELLGAALGREQPPDHPPEVALAEAFDGDRLRLRGSEPGRRVAWPRRQQQQDGMAGQAAGKIREELLRGRVDPVHVFDDEDDRPRVAHAEEDVANGAEGPLLELGTGQAAEKLLRGRYPEEVSKQNGRFFALEAEESELFGDPVSDLFDGHAIGEAEVAPEHLHD